MEKRTIKEEIAQVEESTLEGWGQVSSSYDKTYRVAGRQEQNNISPQGGGYQDNYSAFKLLTQEKILDPRLDNLREIGLHKTWQNIAKEIGMDNFLKMWRMLSNERDFLCDGDNRINIKFRNYSAYKRYMRNKYIMCLHEAGYKNKEIGQKIKNMTNEAVTYDHIGYIIRQNS